MKMQERLQSLKDRPQICMLGKRHSTGYEESFCSPGYRDQSNLISHLRLTPDHCGGFCDMFTWSLTKTIHILYIQ